MISIHIGFPGVLLRNVDFVGQSVLLSEPTGARVLSQNDFRRKFRSLINGRWGKEKLSSFVGSDAVLARLVEDTEVLVVSQPSVLGTPSELILSARARRRAAARLRSLRLLFGGEPIRFHLLVVQPRMLVNQIFENGVERFDYDESFFTWSSLITELDLVGSDYALTVWDCSEPDIVLEPFLSEIFSQPLLYSGKKAEIGPTHFYKEFADQHTCSRAHKGGLYNEHLLAYRTDLLKISTFPGVTVIAPDDIFD
jgi:hypothetical protein